jgi:hypothetical protein
MQALRGHHGARVRVIEAFRTISKLVHSKACRMQDLVGACLAHLVYGMKASETMTGGEDGISFSSHRT